MAADYSRQHALFDHEKVGRIPITIVGAGSIGSFTCLMLAKVGFSNITVVDFDTVEEHNLPNQFFPLDSVGKLKTHALQGMIKVFTGVDIRVHSQRFNDTVLEGVVIMAVDKMDVRQEIFKVFFKSDNCLGFIDARMGGLEFRVFTITHDTMDRWIWYPDGEAVQERCGERSIIYNVGCVSSIVTAQVCRLVQGKEIDPEIVCSMDAFNLMKV
jgi:molybdopterin/thiamine biosynthesis adenylyltransferase